MIFLSLTFLYDSYGQILYTAQYISLSVPATETGIYVLTHSPDDLLLPEMDYPEDSQ